MRRLGGVVKTLTQLHKYAEEVSLLVAAQSLLCQHTVLMRRIGSLARVLYVDEEAGFVLGSKNLGPLGAQSI